MGQNQAFACKNSDEGIFLNQIKIYRWRADPILNNFIPRVYFKSALAQLQQQKFLQFLQQQEHSQYLEISKFKQEIQSIQYSGDEQIILFQKYACSLAYLKDNLTIEQALYTLQGLLYGYQEIKKVFQTILVDPTCCFVTNQGAVRAWINPNAKSNHAWKQHLGDNNNNSIIQKVIRMTQDSTRSSNKSVQFFQSLNHFITTNQQYNFLTLRKWLNQYCYSQNLQIAKSINLNQKKKEEKDPKIYLRNVRRTEGSDNCKENNQLLLTTQESQAFTNAKSLEKRPPPTIFEVRNINLPYQPLKRSNNTSLFPPNATSQIYSKNNSQVPSVKFSVLVQTQFDQPSQNIKTSDIPKKGAKFHEQMKRNSSALFLNKEQKVLKKQNFVQNSKKPFFLQDSKKPTFLQHSTTLNFLQKSNKLVQKKIEVMLDRPSIRKEHYNSEKCQNQDREKKSMKVSITEHFPDQKEARKENRNRTFVDNQYRQRQSVKSSANGSVNFTRPWITTKTITKLISDNEDKTSFKQSIGQSSDYYNHSVYSGALTQMGRDVGKPVDIIRSKTLKDSQF